MGRKDTQFTEDELAMMRGEDTPDAPEDDEAQAASAEDDTTDDDADAAPEGDAPAADADAASSADEAEEADDEPAAFVPKFDGTLPEDFDAQKKALRAEKAELRTKWASGELSDDEFNEAEAKWEDKYEALQGQYLTAKALAEANAQIQRQQAQAVLKSIAAEGAKQGIDYTDGAVAMVYDAKLSQVRGEAAFKGKSFAEVAAEAHNRVAKLFGKTTVAPTGTKADGAKPDQRSKIPQTLATMPAAAAQSLGDDPGEDLDDNPDVAEARWAQMPTSKRAAVLRSTLPATRRR